MSVKEGNTVHFTEEDLEELWRLAERRRAYAKNVTAHEVDYKVDDDGLAHIVEDSIPRYKPRSRRRRPKSPASLSKTTFKTS